MDPVRLLKKELEALDRRRSQLIHAISILEDPVSTHGRTIGLVDKKRKGAVLELLREFGPLTPKQIRQRLGDDNFRAIGQLLHRLLYDYKLVIVDEDHRYRLREKQDPQD